MRITKDYLSILGRRIRQAYGVGPCEKYTKQVVVDFVTQGMLEKPKTKKDVIHLVSRMFDLELSDAQDMVE